MLKGVTQGLTLLHVISKLPVIPRFVNLLCVFCNVKVAQLTITANKPTMT